MIFFDRDCNYPHADLRHVVADPVPPLGHGARVRLTTRASSKQGHALGHLSGGDEGDGRHAEDRRSNRKCSSSTARSTRPIRRSTRTSFPIQQPRHEARACNLAAADSRNRAWRSSSGGRSSTMVPDLPSPLKTWQESKIYILEAARETRRNGSGHRAARVLQPDAGGARIPARHRDRRRRSDSCSACRRR